MSTWGDMRKRAEGMEVRKEDLARWSNLSFVTKDTDAKKPLTDIEKVSIIKAALAEFKLGGFKSLDEMLGKLSVTLEISAEKPSRTVPAAISEWELYWKNELKRLEALGYKEDDQFYDEAKKEADKARTEADNWGKMKLLGHYDRFNQKILLYPNNMPVQDKEKYLVTTFIHEAMHAYFDRHYHELFPYVAKVEEPLAEFGMLLFLESTSIIIESEPLFEWAEKKVKDKKTCYRYGAALMDFYRNGDTQIREDLKNDLESYKRKIF